MITLNVNGKNYNVDVTPDTPLLWTLRDNMGMTGTKYGCGISECGACTVHVNGQAKRSCVTPASSVVGAQICTRPTLTPPLKLRNALGSLKNS